MATARNGLTMPGASPTVARATLAAPELRALCRWWLRHEEVVVDAVLLGVRLALALVFLVAAAAKVRDLPGTAAAATGLGVPARAARPVAVGLPALELGLAIGLLLPATARPAAVTALAVLLVLTAVVLANLFAGRRPPCHCFGAASGAPIGEGTVARNAVLAAAAAAVALGPPPLTPAAAFTGLEPLAAVGAFVAVALAVAVAVQGWMLWQLLAQQGRLLARVGLLEGALADRGERARPREPGLPIGTPAPAFDLPAAGGGRTSLADLLAPGRPVALVFSAPRCPACEELLPELEQQAARDEQRLTLAVVSTGSLRANRGKVAGIPVLVERDRSIAESFGSTGTPAAVLIDPDGAVRSPLAQGAAQVRRLLAAPHHLPQVPAHREVDDRPGHPPAAVPLFGSPAPVHELRDLDGRPVTVGGPSPSETLVLFFNPGCNWCQRLVPDLQAWEDTAPADAPRILVVSTGTLAEHRDIALRSTVALDPRHVVMGEFGGRGTPSAVLVDADGRIASDVAVGAGKVLGLARGGALQH